MGGMFIRLRTPLCLREAAQTLLKRPMRSFLVLQAVVWGTAAAIFPQALYEGSREAAFSRSGEFATDRIIVASQGAPVCPKWEDVPPLEDAHPSIEVLTGVSMVREKRFFLVGTDRSNLLARRHLLAAGRNFSAEEITSGADVCLLEADIARILFPDTAPAGVIDKTVELADGRTLRVIGVLKARPRDLLSMDEFGTDKNHALSFFAEAMFAELGVLPTGLAWLNSERNVLVPWKVLKIPPRWIILRTQPEEVPAVMDDLKERFAEAGTSPVMYSNVVLSAILAPEMEGILGLSRDIFAICLLVGIVVVANVMLMSVNERRMEIAIRRCEGAQTSDIMAQFMLETSLFCAAGALMGIPLGIFLAWARASLDPAALLTWALPWHHILVTTVCVSAGGLVAGLAPAWRASRLDPVEVLSRA